MNVQFELFQELQSAKIRALTGLKIHSEMISVYDRYGLIIDIKLTEHHFQKAKHKRLPSLKFN